MSAERRGAAAQNCVHHLEMEPGEPLSAVFEKAFSGCADDVGHLDRRPRHLTKGRCARRTSAGHPGGWRERSDAAATHGHKWRSASDRCGRGESGWCAGRRRTPQMGGKAVTKGVRMKRFAN